MARKKTERNISTTTSARNTISIWILGIDPETGRQAKQTKTFPKLMEARAALRRHETERDKGQTVIPRELTLLNRTERAVHQQILALELYERIYPPRKRALKHQCQCNHCFLSSECSHNGFCPQQDPGNRNLEVGSHVQ